MTEMELMVVLLNHVLMILLRIEFQEKKILKFKIK